MFKESWSKFDPDAVGCIAKEDFSNLLIDLGPPLGWDDKMKNDKERQIKFL